jgi:hypothetical protein
MGISRSEILDMQLGAMRDGNREVDTDEIFRLMRLSEGTLVRGSIPLLVSGYEQERKNLIPAYCDFVRSVRPTHALTFVANSNSQPELIRLNIQKWCARAERKALGTRWFKWTESRLRLVAFLEKNGAKPRYLGFGRIPERQMITVENLGAAIWDHLMPGGQFEARPIRNLEGSLRFATKQLRYFWGPENVAVYAPILK